MCAVHTDKLDLLNGKLQVNPNVHLTWTVEGRTWYLDMTQYLSGLKWPNKNTVQENIQ